MKSFRVFTPCPVQPTPPTPTVNEELHTFTEPIEVIKWLLPELTPNELTEVDKLLKDRLGSPKPQRGK